MCHNLCFREHEFGWWQTQWFMLFLYSTFEFFHTPPPPSTPTLIHVYQSFPLRWQSLPVCSLPALADIKLPYNVLCLIVVFLSLIRETQSTASILKQEATALFQVFTLQMTLFDSHIFFSSDQTNDSKSNKNQKRWAYYSFEMPPQFYLGVALYLLKSPTCNFNSQIFA